MFVIGTNSTGFDGNTEYAGHSIVINPNGDLVGELNESTRCFDCRFKQMK